MDTQFDSLPSQNLTDIEVLSIKKVGSTSGYDGHSLRAKYYYPDTVKLPDDSVATVNNVAKLYPEERQSSKAPTFALTYQGTYKTLMANCGFDTHTAQQIEANYHQLYEVSDKWVSERLLEASKQGYVVLCFGLRLHTPYLANYASHSGYKSVVEQERRSAGNALGQSYCMLTMRAANAVLDRILNSEYALDISPSVYIHDALYFMWKDKPEVTKFLNDVLIQEMEWQDWEPIKHDKVHLSAELEVYKQGWDKPISIPNKVSLEEIQKILES